MNNPELQNINWNEYKIELPTETKVLIHNLLTLQVDIKFIHKALTKTYDNDPLLAFYLLAPLTNGENYKKLNNTVYNIYKDDE